MIGLRAFLDTVFKSIYALELGQIGMRVRDLGKQVTRQKVTCAIEKEA